MNGEVRPCKVMRLRFVKFLRGKSLVQWICVLAVGMTSILHVDASFAATPADFTMLAMSQDDDQGADDQVVSERCNFCSVTAIANLVTSLGVEPTCPTVPSGRVRSLVTFKLPTTAPPPKA